MPPKAKMLRGVVLEQAMVGKVEVEPVPNDFSLGVVIKVNSLFLLARQSQDVFQLFHIPQAGIMCTIN